MRSAPWWCTVGSKQELTLHFYFHELSKDFKILCGLNYLCINFAVSVCQHMLQLFCIYLHLSTVCDFKSIVLENSLSLDVSLFFFFFCTYKHIEPHVMFTVSHTTIKHVAYMGCPQAFHKLHLKIWRKKIGNFILKNVKTNIDWKIYYCQPEVASSHNFLFKMHYLIMWHGALFSNAQLL